MLVYDFVNTIFPMFMVLVEHLVGLRYGWEGLELRVHATATAIVTCTQGMDEFFRLTSSFYLILISFQIPNIGSTIYNRVGVGERETEFRV